MKVLNILDVHREEFGLYYRRNFTANVVLELLSKQITVPASFIIETDPLGRKLIDVDIDANNLLNYPLIPVKTAIKQFIETIDNQGQLP